MIYLGCIIIFVIVILFGMRTYFLTSTSVDYLGLFIIYYIIILIGVYGREAAYVFVLIN